MASLRLTLPRIEGRRGAMEARGDVDAARQMGQLEAAWSAMDGIATGEAEAAHSAIKEPQEHTSQAPASADQRGQTPGGPCPPRQAADLLVARKLRL